MECSFCDEIQGGGENSFFEIYLKDYFYERNLSSRIVGETENFFIMPMVGPLVKGYLLIVPKAHYLSMAQLPLKELEELQIIKKELKKIMTKEFGKCIFFEHGAVSCSLKGGSCSDHAHLHVVSVDVDVKDDIDNYGYKLRNINNYSKIIEQTKRNMPYLYYENQKGERFLADAPIVESQFIRKLIAKKNGDEERMLWNENIRKDWMVDIVKKLRPYFEKLRGSSIWK